jgi:hypothetical protein
MASAEINSGLRLATFGDAPINGGGLRYWSWLASRFTANAWAAAPARVAKSAFQHAHSRTSLICPLSQPADYRGATNPTGPTATHTDNAAVFARTLIASPAPGSRTKTRFSPGLTGTFVSVPSDSDIVIDPSLLAR